jgi:hypothetical protein
MKRKDLVYVCSLLLINLLAGCSYRAPQILHKQTLMTPSADEKKTKTFKNHIEVNIPLKIFDKNIYIQADVSRPEKKFEPKTLFILVPGSGNVSRRGEAAGNGIDLYNNPLELYSLWSQALSEEGFFVLSYDKRSCSNKFNILCKNNPTNDIDEKGIKALAQDLDQIYDFAASKLASTGENTRIVLMTSTQGTQVISLASCAKKASAIVLLSPLVGDLGSLWVEGLMRASHQANNSTHKSRLLNEAESTKSFFSSLQKFPDKSHVHGASIKFWRSWLDTSLKSAETLAALNKNILVLLSGSDVFSAAERLKNRRNFTMRVITEADRNFINNGHLAPQARQEVIKYIKNLL